MGITVDQLKDKEVVDIEEALRRTNGVSPVLDLIAVLAQKKEPVFFESGQKAQEFRDALRSRYAGIMASRTSPGNPA